MGLISKVCVLFFLWGAVEGVGVEEKLSRKIPRDLAFYDEDGHEVKLTEFFRDGKPVILTLVYYSCPRLCTLILNGVADAVNGMPQLFLGKDFRMVSVSINPEETPALAGKKANNYHMALRRTPGGTERSDKDDWHFLTGKARSIQALTDSVGFRYTRSNGEFAHPSVIVVLTPEGVISRYLYGIVFDPKDVRLALLEAARGKIGSSTIANRLLLLCYRYDPTGRKYVFYAHNIMRAAGVLTVLGIGGLVLYLSRKREEGRRLR